MPIHNLKVPFFFGIILLIIAIGMPAPVRAHKTVIFAWVEGDTVHTESKFSGGRKAKHATVEVFDVHGSKLLEGKTDENGAFSFKLPKKAELRVVLSAGAGHRGEWIIPLEEIEGGEPVPETRTESQISEKKQGHLQNEVPTISAEDIQNAVEKVLDNKLKPILNQLADLREKDAETKITDIISGIGYILGLVGIGAYVNYRKKKTGAGNS